MIKVEIADNPEKWKEGLMFRKSLEHNNGMLFKFDKPQELKFWGVNTYIPLDIAFISQDNVIKKISKIVPMSTKSVSSEERCLYAIETNVNFFKENNIDIGDNINIEKNKENENIVVFNKNKG